MSGFTQHIDSAFLSPNELLTARYGGQAAEDTHQNALMYQAHAKQALGINEVEYLARAAQSLLSLGDEAKMAEAYPGAVAALQRNNMGMNAPTEFPGRTALERIAAMGTASSTLGDQQAAGAAAAAGAARLGGGTPGPGAMLTGPGSATRPENSGGPPAAGSPGAAVAQRAHDFWRGKGYSEEQVAGILAGGPGSESDFTPSVMGDNGTSYGLYQHHGPRYAAMQARYGTDKPSEAQQHEYAAWEISPQGPYAKVGEALKTAKTPAEAATIWTRDFGVPGDKTEIDRRARGAGRFLGLYAQGGVASRTGGVDVAGPGGAPAAPGGAPVPPPAAPDLPAELRTGQDGLTPADNVEFLARYKGVRKQSDVTAIQTDIEQRKQFNAARQDHWISQQRQAAADTATAAERTYQHGRNDAADKLAQDKAQREADLAAAPRHGNELGAQHEADLITLAPKIADGTATEAEKRQYSLSVAGYQISGQPVAIADPTDPTGRRQILARLPRELPSGIPPAPYPVGGTTGARKPVEMSQDQATAATYADRMERAATLMEPLDNSAVTWAEKAKEKGGNFIGYNINNPDYQRLRQAQLDFLNAVLRKESGAAISAGEYDKYAEQYFPRPGDDAATIKQKQENRRLTISGMQREAGPGYQPAKPPTTTTTAAPAASPPPANRPPLSSFEKK